MGTQVVEGFVEGKQRGTRGFGKQEGLAVPGRFMSSLEGLGALYRTPLGLVG